MTTCFSRTTTQLVFLLYALVFSRSVWLAATTTSSRTSGVWGWVLSNWYWAGTRYRLWLKRSMHRYSTSDLKILSCPTSKSDSQTALPLKRDRLVQLYLLYSQQLIAPLYSCHNWLSSPTGHSPGPMHNDTKSPQQMAIFELLDYIVNEVFSCQLQQP